MKKFLALGLAMMMSVAALTGCGGGSEEAAEGGDTAAASGAISVVSREDGSGTRGAFIELFGIEEKNDAGEKVDMTTEMAEITNSTAVMMTTVAGNPNAIGYISLGSLDDSVKALKIDGAEATAENIKNGTYKVARPFNIATKEDISEVASDFIAFIMSDEGQAVVEENGYISQGSTGAYTASNMSGKIVVAGSSSITPVMEKLKEAYIALNPNVTIEVQQNDSTTGMTSVAEGTCDIGMASRELKDSELANGLQPTVIAMDGIAVIVNQENTVSDMTSDTVKAIFTGATTDWSEVA
ncbi:substrate-binding domain-containing protein [Anaerotignum lactatifermentans]|uniref:substrate-binding domain-containing protein n=1 Tax=Anaerotignum lactatifermentans TaxID=160404 RepID=UPI0017499592|nr:substrate-binding domain-containing protein [Anaerotignum lactatifermentans]HJE92442.1 substrate-binding domain-containing protein [Anaerotignum lactatifermentans]